MSRKLTLGDFTIECLGVEYPDYFQGYGTSFSGYDHCVVGIGDTESVALSDCIEQMAESDSFDFTDDDEKCILEDYGSANDSVTAADELGVDVSDEESSYNDFPAFWRVGIKWNTQEETRYNRIRKIPNIRPIRYESYEHMKVTDHSTAWGYKHRADGSASYGDFKGTDWPGSAGDYCNSLCDDDEETNELYFYVPFATYSDYSGSTVEASNADCIESAYDEHDWVHPVYGGHGTHAVAIGVTGLLTCDEDLFDELCETFEGLANYPLIDEQAHSDYETEAIDKAWESWARADFISALEKKFDGNEFNFPDDSDDCDFRSLFENQDNCEWWCEGSGPDMYIRIDDVVKEIEFDDVSKYVLWYKVTYNDAGEVIEDYSDKSEASKRVDALRAGGFFGARFQIVH